MCPCVCDVVSVCLSVSVSVRLCLCLCVQSCEIRQKKRSGILAPHSHSREETAVDQRLPLRQGCSEDENVDIPKEREGTGIT